MRIHTVRLYLDNLVYMTVSKMKLNILNGRRSKIKINKERPDKAILYFFYNNRRPKITIKQYLRSSIMKNEGKMSDLGSCAHDIFVITIK